MTTPREFDFHRIISIDDQNNNANTFEDCCGNYVDFDNNYYNNMDDPLADQAFEDVNSSGKDNGSSSLRKKLSTDHDSEPQDNL